MGDNTTNNASSEQNQNNEEVVKKGDESAETTNKNTDTTQDDSTKLSDEQWKQVFESPRFKELNKEAKEAKKQLAERQKKDEEDAQNKLKEEGKYQELLEAKDKENIQLKSSLSDLQLDLSIMSIASKLKVVDTDAVRKLIDKSKLETDKDGKYLNVEEVVKDLLTEKPYLAGDSSSTSSNIGSKANATTDSQNGSFVMTKSELQAKLRDHKWYEEHKDEITTWQKEGRIDLTK
jgi:hypothetical protein